MTIRPASTGNMTSARPARYRHARPADTIVATTASTSTTGVPRSFCATMSAAIPPATRSTGPSAHFTSSMRCIRRSSTAAENTIATSFASSEGWKCSPNRAIQRVAPLRAGNRNTAMSATTVNATIGQITSGFRST